MCGCVRVCDTSLEPICPQSERMIVRFRFARAARPQHAKMLLLLHKTALSSHLESYHTIMLGGLGLYASRSPNERTPAARTPERAARPQ